MSLRPPILCLALAGTVLTVPALVAAGPRPATALAILGLLLAGAALLWSRRPAPAPAPVAAAAAAAAAKADGALAAVLGQVSDGIYMLDRDWRVREINAAAALALRHRREALLGTVLWDSFPGLDGSSFGVGLRAAMAAQGTTTLSGQFVPLAAWHEARCVPVPDGLTVLFRDVTWQRETEERLHQSQKLEALGQLTGGIAHDVNNLLTIMLGNYEMLADEATTRGAGGAEDRALAEAGLRAGESASRLMHRLLAFSRRQPLQPVVVDMGGLLGSLEPMLRRTLGETVKLEIAVEAGLWRGLIDPAGLENALLNLAINARDAMLDGGQLRIAASNVSVDRVYAAVAGLERTGDYVLVSVADTGVGMTAEVRRQAFEPFFTTKPVGRGTGLGLSMVYGFATQSGGTVLLDSEPGQGTIVRLYLPRTSAPLPARAETESAQAIEGEGETVLLVEDNALLREHTADLLRGLGYVAHEAADGTEALLALHDGLQPDLLFTDMILPGGMNGQEVADAAARILPGLRVLFTSGLPVGEARGRGVRRELPMLRKPFRRAELAARLRERLAAPPWRPE